MFGLATALPSVIELVDGCMLHNIPGTVVDPDLLDGLHSCFHMIDVHHPYRPI